MDSATFAADADGVVAAGELVVNGFFAGDGFDAGFGAGDDGVVDEGDGRMAETMSVARSSSIESQVRPMP